MMGYNKALGVFALMAMAAGTAAQAATQAYWRFEDKNGLPAIAGDFLRSTPAGGGAISGGNTVDVTSDSSGNGNELRAFHSPNDPTSPEELQRLETSPSYTLTTPSAIILQTGAPNLYAFDFDAAPGIGQQPAGTLPNDAFADDIYSLDGENAAGPINNLVFSQYTVEGAFRVDTLGRFQSIMVKDGNVGTNVALDPAGPLPSFNVKLFNNNTLNVETFDGAGVPHLITADAPVSAATWYKFAVVNDGSLLQLYLDSGSGYVLQADQEAVSGGALFNNNSVWAVGRGWFFGVNDFFDGQIDEVRISDVALSPSQFLFNAIPEPSTALLMTGAFAACCIRRRRCTRV